jgi:hypothetical protein
MSCHSNKIVRVTYPKNCCPEVDDSQQLIYPGPALPCIDVQTNQTFNDAVKELDTLLCNAIQELFECKQICLSVGLETGEVSLTIQSTGAINGKPSYENISIGELNTIDIKWSNTNNEWEFYLDDELVYTLDSECYFPIPDANNWVCVADAETCLQIISISTYEGVCTTTTTTTIPPSSICFSFGGEGLGEPYLCTIQPESGLANGRLYYKMLQPDCVTPWEPSPGETIYIYFNVSPGLYQNKWVMGLLLEPLRINQYLDLDVPPDYPIGISGVYATQPPTNSGTWKGGNDETDQWFIGSSVLECPEPVDICFTHTKEASPIVSCNVSPEPGLVNGKLYYKAVNDDCVTQFTSGVPAIPYYVWFSTSGTYINKWVVSPLYDNGIDVTSYLPVSSSPDYPIGEWTIVNPDIYFITNSALTCSPPPIPSICFILQTEGEYVNYANTNFPIGTSPALYNGKVWYGDTIGDRCIYWDLLSNLWVYDLNGLGGGFITGSLDNNNNDFPISDSTYQWIPGCGGETVNETICSSEATSCPENICFGVSGETTGGVTLFTNQFPQPSLINGKVWYKGQILDWSNDYFYIYWDNTNTYNTGGAWVAGVSTNGSLTPPLSPTNVAWYSGSTGNYPTNCAFNCIPAAPWNLTPFPIELVSFTVSNRGTCP